MDNSTFRSLERRFQQIEDIKETIQGIDTEEEMAEYANILTNVIVNGLLSFVHGDRLLDLFHIYWHGVAQVCGITYEEYIAEMPTTEIEPAENIASLCAEPLTVYEQLVINMLHMRVVSQCDTM